MITSYGEYNLTDAIECMIRSGVNFRAFKVQNWFDCGKKETLLESNAKLLKKFGGTIDVAINQGLRDDLHVVERVLPRNSCRAEVGKNPYPDFL